MGKAWSILSHDINVYLGRQSGGEGSPIESTHFEHTFFYYNQPKTGWWGGLGTRLVAATNLCMQYQYRYNSQSVNIASEASM